MDNLNLRWEDKDHVWINGVQFISLQRTGEMLKERTEKKACSEETLPKDDFPLERYRLTLRHDMISGPDVIRIDQPFVVEYCMPRGICAGGPLLINEMLERMRSEVLNHYAKEKET